MRSKEPSQLRYLLLSVLYQPKVLLRPPLPPEGDEGEALPQRELNLDGLIPPPLVKLRLETLQEDRASQASFEALPHELSTVPKKDK